MAANSRKSPLIGGFLSLIFPGAGQLYNEDYGKGITLIAMAISAIGSIVYHGIYLGNIQESGFSGVPEPGPIVVIVVSSLALVAIWLYGIIDAANGARRWNTTGVSQREVTVERSKEGQISLGVVLFTAGLIGLLLQYGVRLEQLVKYGGPLALIAIGGLFLLKTIRPGREDDE